MKIKLFVALIAIIFAVPETVYADKGIKNGVETTLKISREGFNEIKIISDGDKIKSIKSDDKQLKVLPIISKPGNGILYDIEIIYVRFLKDEPANLIMTTEKGATYKLLLVPTSVPEEDLTLRSYEQWQEKSNQAQKWTDIFFISLIFLLSLAKILEFLHHFLSKKGFKQ